MTRNPKLLSKGTLAFTVESRLLRELGERLVKEPEVALVELIKNAHDADATVCDVEFNFPKSIVVRDNGNGMTYDDFVNGWMRIGTSSKKADALTAHLSRPVTGEKGIGRFAVRFLGRALSLRSVADDAKLKVRTALTAKFDWPEFDLSEDLGKVRVPYVLSEAAESDEPGTTLTITALRSEALDVDTKAIRSASLSVLTSFQSLLRHPHARRLRGGQSRDPGFSLLVRPTEDDGDDEDVARAVLAGAVLRAVVELRGGRLSVRVFRGAKRRALLEVDERISSLVGSLYADIRFFPQRKGTFSDMPVNGSLAKRWIKENSGVAVFDRGFRVLPYGTDRDDWLQLAADAARRSRDPRSTLAQKHFPMDRATHSSTQENFMLRLPHPQQLVGIVEVEGARSDGNRNPNKGLIAAADREGFVANSAFEQLQDLVRGAVEAIASVDREVQLEEESAAQKEQLRALKAETRAAVRDIEKNPNLRRDDKSRIIAHLVETQELAQAHEERSREMQSRLEVMSLLGVVAGFMTHEFGVALDELEKGRKRLALLANRDPALREVASALAQHTANLREFVTYSQGYIQGAATRPTRPFPARPRIQQVVRVFGRYASEREIKVEIGIDGELLAPLVPVSLYNGVGLNLFTNALKAVMAKAGPGERRIAFRAWNEKDRHFLAVSDTGVGIPESLRERVFDPLFTTTSSNRDPLGSGLGLGLSLVRRGVESFGGRVAVVPPPTGFSTCVEVELPLAGD